jgi:ATP-dependent HslUV protease subunit HslV
MPHTQGDALMHGTTVLCVRKDSKVVLIADGQVTMVELAKEWRKDRALRHLEALLIVADSKGTFILSGNGDVIEPDDGIVAIGSGGSYALAAARALTKHSKLNAKDLAMEAMRIASEICIYTNANFTVEEI